MSDPKEQAIALLQMNIPDIICEGEGEVFAAEITDAELNIIREQVKHSMSCHELRTAVCRLLQQVDRDRYLAKLQKS